MKTKSSSLRGLTLAGLAGFAFFAVLLTHSGTALADSCPGSAPSGTQQSAWTPSATQGGTAQTVTEGVYNQTPTNGEPLSWTNACIYYTSGSGWLGVSPASWASTIGAQNNYTPVTFTATPNLSAGTYSANVYFIGDTNVPNNGQANGNSLVPVTPAYVPVTFTVTNPCTITSFGAGSTSIPYNTATTLSWTTTGCTGATLNGASAAPPASGSQSSGNLTSTTVYTFCASGSTTPPCQNVTVNVGGPCAITASASPTTVSGAQNSTLTWSTVNCTSGVNITSQIANDGTTFNGTSRGLNGSTSTGALNASQSYLFTASAAGSSDSKTVTVSYNGTCNVTVESNYNGAIAIPPSGGTYAYTITGGNGSPINGNLAASSSNTTNQPAGAQTWTIAFTGTTASGVEYDGVDSSTPNVQSCPSNGGNIVYLLDFNSITYPPTNVVDANSSTNNAVLCQTILVTWTAAQNATGYDVQRNGSTIANNINATSYTDNSALSPATSYTYQVRTRNSSNGVNPTSAWVAAAPTPISPTACQVDLSLSDKLITQVNGKTYPYTSQCIASQSGTAQSLKAGDVLTFQIDVCNRGTETAQSVTVIDTLDPNLTNPGSYTLNGSPVTPTVSGNVITFTVGNVTSNANAIITLQATLKRNSQAGSQALMRFQNAVNIDYTTNASVRGGCVGDFANNSGGTSCTRSTGYVVYYNGNAGPTQQEVSP